MNEFLMDFFPDDPLWIQGEKRLLVAIIQWAISDATNARKTTYLGQRAWGEARAAALDWLESSNRELWSFHWVCSHFEIDFENFQKRIVEHVKAKREEDYDESSGIYSSGTATNRRSPESSSYK